MGQTSYSINPTPAFPGMVAELREATVIISKLAQGNVPVGLLCAPGTDQEVGPSPSATSINANNPGQCVAFPVGAQSSPLADTAFLGIPIYESSRPPYAVDANGNSISVAGEPVPVLRKGTIWVDPDVSVVAFTPVYVWVNPGVGNPPAGTFTNAANGGKAVLFPRGQWLSSSNSGAAGLAILEIW